MASTKRPFAAVKSIDHVQDEIIDEMSDLDDWMDKYEYLVNLGREMETPDGEIRDDKYALQGCQSSVWMKVEYNERRLQFQADSDAMITRGIIALLLRVFDNQRPEDIMDADLYFLEMTGLSNHLSPTRSNGLNAMVNQIQEYAKKYSTR